MSLRVCVACCSLMFCSTLVGADTFFSTESDPFLGKLVPTRPALHSEIEHALRTSSRGDVNGRLARLENELRGTFDALPKNGHGRVESTVVRYLLHRHFLRRHAWLVFGLAPDGGAWNSSSPDAILKGHVPRRVQELLEDHLKRGLNLHETAVVGALIENVVHDDSVKRLRRAWHQCGLPARGSVKLMSLQRAVDFYMLSYIPGLTITTNSTDEIFQKALEIYPTWRATQSFVHSLVAARRFRLHRNLNITDAERVVVDVSEKYGMWQDRECKELKDDLLALRDGTGRVDLRAFYRKAVVEGHWQFTESVPYLRDLGALDESDPQFPGLLIPNYINSPSQYIASSHFYAVSCLDECEPIVDYIEQAVRGPLSSVDRIVELLSTPSPHAELPYFGVSPAMRSRLQDVASQHGGKIPLHGRLFAQWLHHMYPVQCTYPQVAGSTKPEDPYIFEARTGLSSVESDQAMRARIDVWNGEITVLDVEEGLWEPDEELLTKYVDSSANPSAFDYSMTPVHLGGFAGLTSVAMLLLVKAYLLSTTPHAASVALLQVNA